MIAEPKALITVKKQKRLKPFECAIPSQPQDAIPKPIIQALCIVSGLPAFTIVLFTTSGPSKQPTPMQLKTSPIRRLVNTSFPSTSATDYC